jgi:hypothetical protein
MSVASTALLIAPVALHRVLFRQHAGQLLIGFSQRSALAGLALLAMAVIGVVVLIFDLVTGRTGAVIAGVAALVLFGSQWGLVAVILRRTRTADRRDRVQNRKGSSSSVAAGSTAGPTMATGGSRPQHALLRGTAGKGCHRGHRGGP